MKLIFGIFCFCLGVLFRWLSVRKLGKNFKLTFELPDKIVTTGIYRYMRHPSYFGSILIIFGLSLIEPALGITAISFAFFMARIVKEEDVLRYDPDYHTYKQKTGIFFPRIKK